MSIALWNANGLAQHKFEQELFLKQQQIDIMLISETHFTAQNYLKIHSYNFYHTQTSLERHTAAPESSSNPALSITSFHDSRKNTSKPQTYQ